MGRMENSVLDSLRWVVTKIKNFFLAIFNFFVENIFFMGKNNLSSKYRSVNFILKASIVCLCLSAIPLVKNIAKTHS